MLKPSAIISKFLGFDHCWYNGEIVSDAFMNRLTSYVECRPVCPEVEIDMGIPHHPVCIISRSGERRLVQPETSGYITDTMRDFCRDFLASAGHVDGFILRFYFPSYGIKDVKIYPSMEKSTSMGREAGFFGEAVLSRFPLFPVETEGRLKTSG